MEQEARFKQRLGDLENAFARLKEALSQESFNELEMDGVIQRFEFTFELAWKTLKDYLEDQGFFDVASPKKVLQKAFQMGILTDGEILVLMLEDRNKLSHLYKKEMSREIFLNIKDKYVSVLSTLISKIRENI